MRRVAIVSTQGVPACYGGFETLVENLLGDNCSSDIEYTVFCSSINLKTRLKEYKGAKLEYLNWSANGIQSLIYDSISLFKARNFDVILLLGASTPIMPLLRKIIKGKIVYNVDGLSHTRDKYNKFTKWYIYTIKRDLVNCADVLISDNKGIQDYIKAEYGKDSHLIAYGGDHVLMSVSTEEQADILSKYKFNKNEYAISVCRIEPENNCHTVLEAFARSGKNIIYIGNWNHSEYGKNLKEKYSKYTNIQICDPIYDTKILYVLRSNARVYIHGHSVGGTNPSLVEAMFFGIPIIAFNVIYNKETTFHKAYYFSDVDSLVDILNVEDLDGNIMKKLAFENYTWKHIAKQYETLY